MTSVTEARTTPGRRIYAIGDVHGCLEQLVEIQERIERDLADNPSDDWRVIYLGDYVDRGPDSAGVLGHLAELISIDDRHICLMGNHDMMFHDAMRGDARRIGVWLGNGGKETLASYGLTPDSFERRLLDRVGFDDAIPAAHRSFLADRPLAVTDGDFFFAHAGINPDRALDDQNEDDILWIREPFLSDDRDFGAVIIHGHTPVRRIAVRQNRIGIDTGAVFGGTLTCLVLQDQLKARLLPEGRAALV